ncbi:helix-turn-helix domain-containing protein [Yeosuana sp. AK3]
MTTEDENLIPIINLLEKLNSKIDNNIKPPKKHYRNKDLKQLFGLSDNTIISYRDNNILPFTKLGEIFFYPIDKIDDILNKNSNYGLLKQIS